MSVRCAIPFRADGRYTLADLWPSVKKKLGGQKGFEGAHPGLAQAVDDCSWVRNACGAHANEHPVAVVAEETKEFAEQLEKLYDALWCPKCTSFVRKAGGDDWACGCAALAYPAK